MEKIALDGFEQPAEWVFPYPQKYGGTAAEEAKLAGADPSAADGGMQAFGFDDLVAGRHAQEAPTENDGPQAFDDQQAQHQDPFDGPPDLGPGPQLQAQDDLFAD